MFRDEKQHNMWRELQVIQLQSKKGVERVVVIEAGEARRAESGRACSLMLGSSGLTTKAVGSH